MRTLATVGATTLMMLLFASFTPMKAADDQTKLLVPGYEPAGTWLARRTADPKIDYKILFSVSNGAKDRDAEVNPMLPTIARYLNTLGSTTCRPITVTSS